MQIPYNKKNIKLNYLNSYVKYFIDNDTIYFKNTLFNTDFNLNGNEEDIKTLMKGLSNGISNKDLLLVLKKFNSDSETLYKYMLQNFIIE